MQGQRLRLRLQEDEFRALLDGVAACNRTRLPDGGEAVQEIHLAQAAAWHANGATWSIALPAESVRAYAQRLPTREGLHFTLDTAGSEPLEVLFDVDVRDSVKQRHNAGSRGEDA